MNQVPTIPLSRELAKALKKQRKAFIKKFHREPGPDDPIFWDESAATPQFQTAEQAHAAFDKIVAAAEHAGLPPALIYAMRKTRRIVTEQNKQHLTAEDIAEWDAAIAEFKSLN
jgi:hypothetical protein